MLRVQESQFLQFSSFFLVFYCFVSFGCLGELLGASLSFWEPPEVQKNLLGSNVKGSGGLVFLFGFSLLYFFWGLWRAFGTNGCEARVYEKLRTIKNRNSIFS